MSGLLDLTDVPLAELVGDPAVDLVVCQATGLGAVPALGAPSFNSAI